MMDIIVDARSCLLAVTLKPGRVLPDQVFIPGWDLMLTFEEHSGIPGDRLTISGLSDQDVAMIQRVLR